MRQERRYSIGRSWLDNARKNNVNVAGDSIIVTGEETGSLRLGPIDGGADCCGWGRLHMDCLLPDNGVCTVRAAASDDKSTFTESIFINKRDMLLYELQGRYLWLEITVEKGKNTVISSIRIYQRGDLFMDSFPEVYRERNSFFHRYLSVLSTEYSTIQEQIQEGERLLEPQRAPSVMLPALAGLMGLEMSESFLDEETTRRLVKNAYVLNKCKGTKAAVFLMGEILLDERPVVVERNLMGEGQGNIRIKEEQNLYGDSRYDVTILVKGKVRKEKRKWFLYFVDQLKPLKSRVKVIFLNNSGRMDGYTYMDMNGVLSDVTAGCLDSGQTLGGGVIAG